MRQFSFTQEAFDQYNEWVTVDRKMFDRIKKLLQETARTPFEGTGKPEPLKHQLAGCWSRRITQEHRLVYQVSETTIFVINCKGHY